MARQSRHDVPPYEVMARQVRRGSESKEAGVDFHSAPSGAPTEPGYSIMADWLSRARAPVVVRVPHGLAVLIGAGVLTLIMLAYLAGHVQGVQSQKASPVSSATAVAPENEGGIELQRKSGRVKGRYYMVLDTYPGIPVQPSDSYDEVRKLVGYLRRHGVDTITIPVDNDGLQVVGLEGFTKGQLNSQEYRDYESKLVSLGHRWKRKEKGPSDLANMYLQRFTGD